MPESPDVRFCGVVSHMFAVVIVVFHMPVLRNPSCRQSPVVSCLGRCTAGEVLYVPVLCDVWGESQKVHTPQKPSEVLAIFFAFPGCSNIECTCAVFDACVCCRTLRRFRLRMQGGDFQVGVL